MTDWKRLEVERIERTDAPVTVYRLRGVLTNTPESYGFLEGLQERVRKGKSRIVLNLEEVEHITSAGVGILGACYTSVSNAGGRICLTLVPARGRTILNVLKLFEFLPEFPAEEDAVRYAAA